MISCTRMRVPDRQDMQQHAVHTVVFVQLRHGHLIRLRYTYVAVKDVILCIVSTTMDGVKVQMCN